MDVTFRVIMNSPLVLTHDLLPLQIEFVSGAAIRADAEHSMDAGEREGGPETGPGP